MNICCVYIEIIESIESHFDTQEILRGSAIFIIRKELKITRRLKVRFRTQEVSVCKFYG